MEEYKSYVFCSEKCLDKYMSYLCAGCEELVCTCGEYAAEYDNAEVYCETCERFECMCEMLDHTRQCSTVAVYYEVEEDDDY